MKAKNQKYHLKIQARYSDGTKKKSIKVVTINTDVIREEIECFMDKIIVYDMDSIKITISKKQTGT